MAELQPSVDAQINSGIGGPPAAPPPEPAAVAPAAPPPPKRQRRPSVRLGDIGDQHTYENHRRNKQHQWKFPTKDSKSSKTRPLVNLTGAGEISGEFQGVGIDNHQNSNNGGNCNNNGLGGSWKARDFSKSKRGFSGTKRIRSNWGVKMNEGDGRFKDAYDYNYDNNDEDNDNFDDDDDDDDQSLNFSMDNEKDLNFEGGSRGKETRVRVSDGPSDTNARNWNNSNDDDDENDIERNGVRVWLNQLGLGRYAPVFEIHEVDDEVLPLLTLEDLKDMGINAVGSRRKMFCSIQKLGKGFS
ncbi:uncharacterized protein [Rutidosis leptorrhynchoides]|uniref:uncharacterized protein n=1 Tax=Rutidosis leptorrhynchoides TaxID=125765 RepID=UPI003A9908D1